MALLDWLLSTRASILVVPQGVPRDALDTIARAMSAAGFRLVSDVATPQASDYRAAASSDRVVRFEPVVKPRRAEQVRSVVVRQKDDRALRVAVGFGRARGPQVAGAVLVTLIAVALFVARDNAVGAMMLLYYPLAIAIVLLVMPGKVNADAVRDVVKGMETALEGERARAADSVRQRVETFPRVAVAGSAEPAAQAAEDAGEEPPGRLRVP